MVDFKRTQYKNYTFPVLWEILGWGIPVVIVMSVPITAIVKIRNNYQSLPIRQRIKFLSEPHPDWNRFALIENKDGGATKDGVVNRHGGVLEEHNHGMETTRV